MDQDDARDRTTELAFLEGLRKRLPGHLQVLEAVGHLYTESGRYEDGLQADLDLTTRCPSVPVYWYNLACSFALLGRIDEAFATLDKAVAIGYREADWARKDPDLDTLRKDPRFPGMLAKMTEPSGPATGAI